MSDENILTEEEEKELVERHKLKKEAEREIEVKEAEHELLSGRKLIFIGSFGEVVITHPSLEINRECEEVYAKEFTRLLKESDLITTNQMVKILREKGAWTDEDDKELTKLANALTNTLVSINELKLDLRKSTDKKKRKEIEDKIAALENKRWTIQRKYAEKTMYYQNMLSSTIEYRADRKALVRKVLRCTFKSDGKTPLFNSEEEILKYNQSSDMEKLIAECINFWSGIEDPFLERLVEEMIGS